jgi:hypothetical protein
MKYWPTIHRLVLDKKDCYCGDGKQNGRKDCAACKGTGNGPRGGKRGCKPCYGTGWQVDRDNPVTCERCKGDWEKSIPECRTDFIPPDIMAEIFATVPVSVQYRDRQHTTLEALIGVGLYSVTDYGTAYAAKDPHGLRAKVIADTNSTQACKVAVATSEPDVLKVADTILVDVHPNGYTVVALSGTDPIL